MEDNQLYNEEEIVKILKNASQIQTQEELSIKKEGISKKELFEIAEEIGIDKNSLEEAILKNEFSEKTPFYNWLKGTSTIHLTNIIDGEVSKKNWDELMPEIRNLLHSMGQDSIQKKSFEWNSQVKDIGYKHISLAPYKGKTKIRFSSGWKGLTFIVSFFSFLIPFMITSISFDGSTVPFAIVALIASIVGTGGIMTTRLYLKSYFEKQLRLFKNISKKLEEKLSKSNSEQRIVIEDDTYNSENELKTPSTKTQS